MVTAAQTLKMYELLNKYFKNNEDAKMLVQGIEEVIDGKFEAERDRLATKADLIIVKEEVRNDISRLETRMEQGFKDQLKWLIVLMVGLFSLMVALTKLT
jgi:hypothetical protein